MRGKRAKKRRKVFNIYNLLVLVSIVIIGGSAYVLLLRNGIDLKEYPPISYVVEWVEGLGKEKEQDSNQQKNQNQNKPNDNTSKNNNTNSSTTTPKDKNETNKPYVIDPGVSVLEDITEEKAKEIAIEQFKVLGENSLTPDSLECIKIKRDDTLYYYVSSAKNTIEIKIEGGVITRINSELVAK
ncbi:MAG: hypothetical protein HFJ52_08635 [Clostridia bacterium]|jgi:hypothetical protein|nr:hypothetical protein [Clostridia bacterium]